MLALQSCGGSDDPPPETRSENCPEIYASGFRNPWRWSFDRQSGELWVGDVGQSQREEIDRVVLGGNYGWRCFEGTLATNLECGTEANLLPPVAEYGRTEGRSVTGGYVYRGSNIAWLRGRYVFGDFVDGRIWDIPGNTQPTLSVTGGLDTAHQISSFGEDNGGELYVVAYGGGQANAGQLFQLTESASALAVARVFPNLSFTQPLAMLQEPNETARWYVVEKQGRVRVFDNNPLATSYTTFVDISGRVATASEMGLLGMAFHPAFATNRRVYLSYTTELGGRHSRISEFTLDAGGQALDPNSERILLVVSQPETNHNGGQITFGPDGYLYIGMGDGGGGNDIHGTIGNGQRMTTLLGKVLRIDVNQGSPYGIPASNSFASGALCGTPP